jgi:hypothetical protein
MAYIPRYLGALDKNVKNGYILFDDDEPDAVGKWLKTNFM